MRALVVCGSADLSGTSSTMAKDAERWFRSSGFEADAVFPASMRIGHCTGCGACKDGPCIIDDDMAPILDKASRADVIVFSFPVHFSGPSSMAKAVIDRFQPFWLDKESPHPKECAALICGGGPEPRFLPSVSVMRALSITVGMRWRGHLEFPGTDARGTKGSREAVEGFLERAFGSERGRPWIRIPIPGRILPPIRGTVSRKDSGPPRPPTPPPSWTCRCPGCRSFRTRCRRGGPRCRGGPPAFLS
ncbi:MAG: flavodoxin family protein [Candidatus Methanomethylophilaceae archaeon]|nr:flavodoxin family protein [Candidatus Methanomethylophilaceae archaeon]